MITPETKLVESLFGAIGKNYPNIERVTFSGNASWETLPNGMCELVGIAADGARVNLGYASDLDGCERYLAIHSNPKDW